MGCFRTSRAQSWAAKTLRHIIVPILTYHHCTRKSNAASSGGGQAMGIAFGLKTVIRMMVISLCQPRGSTTFQCSTTSDTGAHQYNQQRTCITTGVFTSCWVDARRFPVDLGRGAKQGEHLLGSVSHYSGMRATGEPRNKEIKQCFGVRLVLIGTRHVPGSAPAPRANLRNGDILVTLRKCSTHFLLTQSAAMGYPSVGVCVKSEHPKDQ